MKNPNNEVWSVIIRGRSYSFLAPHKPVGGVALPHLFISCFLNIIYKYKASKVATNQLNEKFE